MENHSAAKAARMAKQIKFSGGVVSYTDDLYRERLSHFAFRRLSEKQNYDSAISAALR
jgi:hypothetical protein